MEVQKQKTKARRQLALASLVAIIFGLVSTNAQAQRGRRGGVVMVPVYPVYPQPTVPQQVQPTQPPPSIIVWEAPQYRNVNGVLVWDGYWRQQTANLVKQNDEPKRDPDAMGKIRRLPKYKDFGNGVRGELMDEDGNEERVTRHTGTNQGRYRLSKYIPGHRDSYGDWIPGHREDLGEEEVGQDLDEERGERRDWSYKKRK